MSFSLGGCLASLSIRFDLRYFYFRLFRCGGRRKERRTLEKLIADFSDDDVALSFHPLLFLQIVFPEYLFPLNLLLSD